MLMEGFIDQNTMNIIGIVGGIITLISAILSITFYILQKTNNKKQIKQNKQNQIELQIQLLINEIEKLYLDTSLELVAYVNSVQNGLRNDKISLGRTIVPDAKIRNFVNTLLSKIQLLSDKNRINGETFKSNYILQIKLLIEKYFNTFYKPFENDENDDFNTLSYLDHNNNFLISLIKMTIHSKEEQYGCFRDGLEGDGFINVCP